MPKKRNIYLDYAATTPLAPEVLKEMLIYLKKEFGNPSSIYNLGQKAQEGLNKARERVANFLNCSISEIFFTSSATEANNLAIFGVVRASQKKGIKPHIITTQIEHHAVLEPCKELEKQGIKVTYLPVDKQGLIRISDLEKAIKQNTVLVSVMYANNEIGTIQLIAEIGKLIQKINSSSKSQASGFKICFHSDAVQAVNYLDCDVKKLGVDLLTSSAHKIYGPKGVGALYVKEGIPILPIIYGGDQEARLRAGTENVAAIVGIGKAVEEIEKSKSKSMPRSETKFLVRGQRIKKLRDKLINGILKNIPGTKLNGSLKYRLPNNINVSIPGVEGESMVIALDQEGIAASTGSACSSRSLEPSHVLLALGLSQEQAHCSLRLTLGKYTNEKEINRVLKILPNIVKRLRKLSGYKLKNFQL